MKQYRNMFLTYLPCFGLAILLCLGLFGPSTAFGGHKLADSQCYDCHVVGSSLADVVDQSRLIRNDGAMVDIINNRVTWSFGNPLPCIFCHDDAGSPLENMIGVKEHFTSASISKHPVDPYNSNSTGDGDGGTLDCIDCHDVVNAVPYVAAGNTPGTPLSPNIHNQNVAAVAWTPEAGLLDTDTFKSWVASAATPYNTGGNSFCTNQCHDNSTGTGFLAGQAFHQYNKPLVSLENGSNFFTASQIAGCLNETATGSGCHAVHNAQNNTDLITAVTWGTSTPIGRDDCGSCHVFDDASTASPVPRLNSDFFARGHGQAGVDQTCLDCHDSAIPHFNADGNHPATGDSVGRLNDVPDTDLSGFSSPPKSSLSTCTTATCHPTFLEHTSSGAGAYPVGCLDCHDPHGYGVGSNIRMMREQAPIASPTVTLSYANSGNWFNSSANPPVGTYTNWACDSADCHPQSISSIMDTSVGNTVPHGGGTGIKTGCESCHKHQGGTYSWEGVGDACDACHDNPPTSGAHSVHNQVAFNDTSEDRSDCAYCHTGADSYTYNTSVDQSGGLNHSNRTSRLASLSATVGYAGTTDDNCTSACHSSSAGGDGIWNDTDGLNCTACHGNPPSGTNHSIHVSSVGLGCDDCHTGVESQGVGPLNHNDAADTTTDALWIETQGNAYVNTTGLDAEVDDSAYNAGGGNSFVNTSSVVSGNTCSTTDCHDPSDAGTLADWDTGVAIDCTFCHGDPPVDRFPWSSRRGSGYVRFDDRLYSLSSKQRGQHALYRRYDADRS